jgi:hypothetical protein
MLWFQDWLRIHLVYARQLKVKLQAANSIGHREVQRLCSNICENVQGFKEEDKPNFTGSYYSHCKAICENLLQPFENVLTLRVRMPIVADLTYQRNFITKIIKYETLASCCFTQGFFIYD